MHVLYNQDCDYGWSKTKEKKKNRQLRQIFTVSPKLQRQLAVKGYANAKRIVAKCLSNIHHESLFRGLQLVWKICVILQIRAYIIFFTRFWKQQSDLKRKGVSLNKLKGWAKYIFSIQLAKPKRDSTHLKNKRQIWKSRVAKDTQVCVLYTSYHWIHVTTEVGELKLNHML